MNIEERQKFLDENVFNSKFSFAVVIGGWCGAYFFLWLAGFTNSSFLRGTGLLFSLFGIYGIPAFLWYFLPITILKLPHRLQLGGQVVGATITALLPLLLFNEQKTEPLGRGFPNLFWEVVLIIIFVIIFIYIGRVLGLLLGQFPTQNRAYLIASGIAWIFTIESSQPASTYFLYILLLYIGVTIGIIKEEREGQVSKQEFAASVEKLGKTIQESYDITDKYGEVLENYSSSGFLFVDENLLPYPKETIKWAIAFRAALEETFKDHWFAKEWTKLSQSTIKNCRDVYPLCQDSCHSCYIRLL